jgi:hypothetical protein
MQPSPAWQRWHLAEEFPIKQWTRKLAGCLGLGISQRLLSTMTSLDNSSRRRNWKSWTSSIAPNWPLSWMCAGVVVRSPKPVAVSSVPLALASQFQTMRIGSANTSVALVWNFRRSKICRPDPRFGLASKTRIEPSLGPEFEGSELLLGALFQAPRKGRTCSPPSPESSHRALDGVRSGEVTATPPALLRGRAKEALSRSTS